MAGSGSSNGRASQAATEYLVAYAVCILIMVVAAVLLYTFISYPSNAVGSACQFSAGPSCLDSIIGTNSASANTIIVLYLANSDTYPITGPNVIIQIGNVNTTSTKCQPNYVRAGGTILCTVNITQKTSPNQLLIGKIYLTSNYCITTTNPACLDAESETYEGSITGHVESINTYKTSITLNASYNSLPPDGQKDNLNATVYLLGYPIRGATVNFTANNTVPVLGGQICGSTSPSSNQPCSSFSNANPEGLAQSNIWSYANTIVRVFANFSGASASVVIRFGNTITVLSKSCDIPGPINTYVVTGTNYTDSRYDPITTSGSQGTYIVYKNESEPLTISSSGAGSLDCFDIDTATGGGKVTIDTNGAGTNSIINMEGNANAVLNGGGAGTALTFDDVGNGAITGSIGGAGDSSSISGGTGNVILTVNGAGTSVSTLSTASTNVILSLSGAGGYINLTSTAPNANVVLNVGGAGATMNVTVASSSTIVIPSISGSGGVYNSIGGNVIISSISGAGATLYFWNEEVYIGSCTGSGNEPHLEGTSTYKSDSPYKGSPASC